MSTPPDPFSPSSFGHLPLHWYTHIMHALEVVGYHHCDEKVRETALRLYFKMVKTLHLNPETKEQHFDRLTEDRMVMGTVVS